MTRKLILTLGLVTVGAAASVASAHPHQANGQVIANGQNHPIFVNGVSCEEYLTLSGEEPGPAWYGLETAHHGPDAGDPGRGDGCYATTGGVPPGQDVSNPVIR